MTATQNRGLTEALERVRCAQATIASGDPQPYMDLWADRADVTLFGAWGPIEQCHEQLMQTFRWVGGRFTDGALVPENNVIYASGDLAYTVGFERGEVSVDGSPPQPMTIRVTHVYRHVDGSASKQAIAPPLAESFPRGTCYVRSSAPAAARPGPPHRRGPLGARSAHGGRDRLGATHPAHHPRGCRQPHLGRGVPRARNRH
ncbi:MAG: YybH family protein [Dehalococcoidia bacterium]